MRNKRRTLFGWRRPRALSRPSRLRRAQHRVTLNYRQRPRHTHPLPQYQSSKYPITHPHPPTLNDPSLSRSYRAPTPILYARAQEFSLPMRSDTAHKTPSAIFSSDDLSRVLSSSYAPHLLPPPFATSSSSYSEAGSFAPPLASSSHTQKQLFPVISFGTSIPM